ncbi:hypothetical protein [Marinifilum flexuosum]|uniref:Uncharacterized protein n=1 Tax=Marinifilum flexuosum TaxID=1117708 RepID=A0A419WMR6_9BACT|nr:hypothetical protein [Marinifilum flexuosum]RKD96759.1 hypothetical protein BXY64_3705 [Marinifilum flexuosum]
MNILKAIRLRYRGHKQHAKKGKSMSKIVFQLEKSKRAKRGFRLIDMNLSRVKTWMQWEMFKRYAWVVAVWSLVLGYFIFKYFAS